MAKLKVSVTIDEEVLAWIDSLAEKSGENRSTLIDRVCRRYVNEELAGAGQKEFWRMSGPMPTVMEAVKAMPHDKDFAEEVEVIWRMDAKKYREALQRRVELAKRKG